MERTLASAHGPGRRPLARIEDRGAPVLLGLARGRWVARPADALPRGLRELVLAVEAVARVGGRVAAGFAGRDRLERRRRGSPARRGGGGRGEAGSGRTARGRTARGRAAGRGTALAPVLALDLGPQRVDAASDRRGRIVGHAPPVGARREALVARAGERARQRPRFAREALLEEHGVLSAHLPGDRLVAREWDLYVVGLGGHGV